MISNPASRIEALRGGLGLTKRAMANIVAVNASFLTNIARGRRPVSRSLAKRIESEFHVSARWLLDGAGPPLLPQYRHPDQLVRALGAHAAAARTKADPGDFPSLPVFDQPIEGNPLEHLHMTKSARRSTVRDQWRTSRYYLRVTEQLARPSGIEVGDYLLVEAEPGDWSGQARCLCLIEVRRQVVLTYLRATGFREGRVVAEPPFDIPGLATKGRSRDARKFKLLGHVVRMERDLPDCGA